MSPKNGTAIDLTVTSSSDPMSVDNIDDELVLTREPIETSKLSSQPANDFSSSLRYTLITASISALYPSAAFPASLTSSSKIHNKI